MAPGSPAKAGVQGDGQALEGRVLAMGRETSICTATSVDPLGLRANSGSADRIAQYRTWSMKQCG